MTSASRSLVIFILSYQRPHLLIEAIESILNQSNILFDLIISENSANDEVSIALKKYEKDSRIKIIHRRPHLQSIEHFNQIFDEAQSYEYFMLFHDDDTMKTDCVEKMLEALKRNPEISAVAANAHIIENSTLTSLLFNPSLVSDQKIEGTDDLIIGYLKPSKGHTPFPSYMYRSHLVKGLTMNFTEGRKHSDVTFLVKAIQRGPFLWLAAPLINYRRHSKNDSAQIDILAIKSLYKFLRPLTKKHQIRLHLFVVKSYLKYLKNTIKVNQ